jgi:hypothetical protein
VGSNHGGGREINNGVLGQAPAKEGCEGVKHAVKGKEIVATEKVT